LDGDEAAFVLKLRRKCLNNSLCLLDLRRSKVCSGAPRSLLARGYN
jgi:hypothetical protein